MFLPPPEPEDHFAHCALTFITIDKRKNFNVFFTRCAELSFCYINESEEQALKGTKRIAKIAMSAGQEYLEAVKIFNRAGISTLEPREVINVAWILRGAHTLLLKNDALCIIAMFYEVLYKKRAKQI